MDPKLPPTGSVIVSEEERNFLELISNGQWGKYGRVAMAALSGIPWVGSLIGAAATYSAEKSQDTVNIAVFLWVKEHQKKLEELALTLNEVFVRFEDFGQRIEQRIFSEEYLSIVRSAFRRWDAAETLEKKEMLRKLLTNAGGVTIVEDDSVRRFLNWISEYDELHFKVIAEVSKNTLITRRNIWLNIRGDIPTDSSQGADLFKRIMDDLTIGRVIRQKRNINALGQFLKKNTQSRPASVSNVMESPFDNKDQYVLTELGKSFVQYSLNELTLQIDDAQSK